MASFRDPISIYAASRTRRPGWKRYFVALVLPAAFFYLTNSFVRFDRAPFFTLLSLSVAVAAVYGGRNAGLFSTFIASALSVFYTPPKYSFSVPDPDIAVRIFLFALGGATLAFIIGLLGDVRLRLEFERERLFTTLSSIGDCVITTDRDGLVTFLNGVAVQATGWHLEEALGRPLEHVFNIVNEHTRQTAVSPVRRVIETGMVVGLANHTVLLRRDGSEIPIDDSAAPIRDLNGQVQGVVLVFRDISSQKRAQAAFLKTEKLASVGRLAATIAHEINNPLEAVSNLLYLVEQCEDIQSAKQFATAASVELRRVAHVTHQTLAFARHSSPRRPTDLGQIATEVLSLFEGRLKSRSIAIVKEMNGEAVAEVSADEVRQVVANLVSNALDAVAERGKIHIRAKRSTWAGESRIRLTIADTGIGINPTDLPHVFEPFFSTKQDVGTGLGLWVSKSIIEAHDGCLHLRSQKNKGTVVIACWPEKSKANAAFSN